MVRVAMMRPALLVRLSVAPAIVLLLALAGPPALVRHAFAQERPDNWLPQRVEAHPLSSYTPDLFPILFFAPETRLGGGIGAWFVSRDHGEDSGGKPNHIWLSAVYTQERQTIVQVIPEFFFAGDTYRLKARLRYLDFPTRYFGIGGDAPEVAEELYTPVVRTGRFTFTRRIQGAWSAGPVADYNSTEIVRVEPAGALAGGTVPGATGSELSGLGAVLRWDTREHHFNPRGGGLLDLAVLRFHDREGEAFKFTEAATDLRGYFAFGERQVLGLQWVLITQSGTVPFTALPQLGGKFLFRGYFEGRFRDRHMTALQAEHRVELTGRWGLTGFVSWGDVARELNAFRLSDFKLAGGLGLRYLYNRLERINLRLDVATTEESAGVYFSVGEAF